MPKQPLGVLMLHGFPGNHFDFEPLEPAIRSMGLPCRVPTFRGMLKDSGSALEGITWQDWYADARAALFDLLQEVEKVIVIGYSMGGALTVRLAAEAGETMDSLVLAAAAVQLDNPIAPGKPLHFLVPALKKVLKRWILPPNPVDGYRRGYPWVPLTSVLQVAELSTEARNCLGQVRLPVLLLQGHKDDVVARENLEIIYNGLATPPEQKRMQWFDGSTHEMFFDDHTPEVVQAVLGFVKERVGKG